MGKPNYNLTTCRIAIADPEGFITGYREPESREDYLRLLRGIGRDLGWKQVKIGVLECKLDLGTYSRGYPRAAGKGLQVHDETDQAVLRRRCIGSMRAWVVRNIPKAQAGAPSPSEGTQPANPDKSN